MNELTEELLTKGQYYSQTDTIIENLEEVAREAANKAIDLKEDLKTVHETTTKLFREKK